MVTTTRAGSVARRAATSIRSSTTRMSARPTRSTRFPSSPTERFDSFRNSNRPPERDRRRGSPSGCSTFTTSAPASARSWGQSGPAICVVRSTTRKPCSMWPAMVATGSHAATGLDIRRDGPAQMSREIDLTGKVAVITGGGGGIGGAVSEALATAGAHVVVAEIDHHLARERVAAITDAGHRAESVVVDVRDPEDIDRLATTVLEGHRRVDVPVNNVGHYLTATPFLGSDRAHRGAVHGA